MEIKVNVTSKFIVYTNRIFKKKSVDSSLSLQNPIKNIIKAPD